MYKIIIIINLVFANVSYGFQKNICSSATDSTFWVEQIYWDYDSDKLNSYSIRSLEPIVDYLRKNNSMSLELKFYQHLNPYKSAIYSRRRLKSILSYFVKQGIAKTRLRGEVVHVKNINEYDVIKKYLSSTEIQHKYKEHIPIVIAELR
jgi:hypothetical protein